MKCIDPLVTGYERGTFEERSAPTESSPRQSRKNSEDDSRANNNIRETLGILSATMIVLAPKPHQETVTGINDFVWRMCVSYGPLNSLSLVATKRSTIWLLGPVASIGSVLMPNLATIRLPSSGCTAGNWHSSSQITQQKLFTSCRLALRTRPLVLPSLCTSCVKNGPLCSVSWTPALQSTFESMKDNIVHPWV